MDALPADVPRYAVHEYEYVDADDRKASKIVLLSRLPDSSPMKLKTVFGSNRSTFRTTLPGIAVGITPNDYDNLDTEEVTARVIR